jgi:hypothetical protein
MAEHEEIMIKFECCQKKLCIEDLEPGDTFRFVNEGDVVFLMTDHQQNYVDLRSGELSCVGCGYEVCKVDLCCKVCEVDDCCEETCCR